MPSTTCEILPLRLVYFVAAALILTMSPTACPTAERGDIFIYVYCCHLIAGIIQMAAVQTYN